MTPRELQSIVAFFRPLGFDVSVESVIARSKDDAWIGSLLDYTPDPEDPKGFADLNVLAFDRARVWRLESWEILFEKSAKEQGYAYCRSYVDVVDRLAAISKHQFAIAAKSTGKKGELDVTFARKKHRIRFRTDLGVFCSDVLRALNEVIEPSGCRYVFVSNGYCQGFVVLLSADEEKQILRRRKWKLEPLG